VELVVALAQMALIDADPASNQAAARKLASQAAYQGADLLMLPELWPTGYDLARAGDYAAPLSSGPFALMADMAREHRFYVVGTALEANAAGAPFNTAALVGPDGQLVATYRKVHLFPPMGETRYMTAGADLPTFDLPWGRTALAICYDLRFPELWRRYTAAGARLILIPAEWPVPRIEHWRLLLRARAVENQLFVVGCNRASSGAVAGEAQFGGHAAAVDPWGRVLVEGSLEPGLFIATLDLDEVARCRRALPYLHDRHPEVYGPESAWPASVDL
jgi:omega-amidase